MANKHATLAALFTDIADAIRAKTGDTNLIPAKQFPSVIRSQLDSIPPLVDFTIGGVAYKAPEGIKWGDWCVNDYNTGGFEIKSPGKIIQSDSKMQIDGVVADDVIIHGTYDLVVINTIAFTIRVDNNSPATYEANNGMTWSQWCDSSYNLGGYTIRGNYVTLPGARDYVIYQGNYVLSTDLIIENREYILYTSGGGGSN